MPGSHVVGYGHPSATSHLTRNNVLKALATADPTTLVHVLTELGHAGEEKAAELRYVSAVAEHLDHSDEHVIAAAATALGPMGSLGLKEGGRRLTGLLQHPSSAVRIAVLEAFGNFGPSAKQHAPAVAALVQDKESIVRVVALHALGDMAAHSEVAVAEAALRDSCPEVVSAACDSLSKLGHVAEGIGSALAAGLGNNRTRFSALSALVDLGDKAPADCAAGIAECLADVDSATRTMAVAAVDAGVPCSEARVLELVKDEWAGARSAAICALGAIEGGHKHQELIASFLEDLVEDDSQLPFLLGGGGRRLPPYLRRPQCAALVTLGKLSATRYSSDIAAFLSHSHFEVRCCALEALGELGTEGCEYASEIAALLDDPLYPVRAKACKALGQLGAAEQLERLVDAFKDSAYSVKEAAASAVGAYGDAALDHAGALVELFGDIEGSVRAAAVAALPLLGELAHVYAGMIATLLQDEDEDVRVAVLEALPQMGDYGLSLTEDMADHLFDVDKDVRAAAKEAMRKLGDTGENFLRKAPNDEDFE